MIEIKLTNLKEVRRGDILRNNGTGNSYVVLSTYGDRILAVRDVTVTNPSEWTLVILGSRREFSDDK